MSIYMLQATNGGPIKIGCSSLPKVRQSALSTLFPYGVDLICQMDGARIGETFLHHCFEPLRISNEWFQNAAPLWRFVLSVVDHGAPEFLPDEDRWSQEEALAEAVALFGSVEGAKRAMGYAASTPVSQIFSLTSGTNYSVRARMAFHRALMDGRLPTYIAELHASTAPSMARAS